MRGLNLEIISTASLVVMKGGFFNKKKCQKMVQITLNTCIVTFKTLHFESVIQCRVPNTFNSGWVCALYFAQFVRRKSPRSYITV